jgi:hypothetical protein
MAKTQKPEKPPAGAETTPEQPNRPNTPADDITPLLAESLASGEGTPEQLARFRLLLRRRKNERRNSWHWLRISTR